MKFEGPINIVGTKKYTTWLFPTLKNNSRKGNDMAKADTFKVVVKDGDTKYAMDKSGRYESKTIDYVAEYDTLAEALTEFLTFVGDVYAEEKVSLVFKRGNKK